MVQGLKVFRHYFLLSVFRYYTFLTALCFFASLIHLISNNEKGWVGVNIPLGCLVMLIPRFYATV